MRIILCLLICCLPACSMNSATLGPKWIYSDDTLGNGMRVITMEDHSAPIVAIELWYHVGSKDERPDRTGFAHMFEHMMFRGTDRLGPDDHFKYLRRYGGNVNGYTHFDRTVYVQEVPPNQVDLTFWLEAERMANLKINEDYFAKEREVVKEEYRRSITDPPYGEVYIKVLKLAFKKHPYRWTPIGNLDHLNAATSDELQDFFDTYYVPNNATLVVVGDVDRKEILAKARRYFGWIPRRPDPPRISVSEPPITEPRRLETYDKGPVTLAGIGFHAPGLNHPDRQAMKIFDNILSGESGRLYQKLVKKLEIAVEARSIYMPLEQNGLWGIGAVVKPLSDAQKNLTAMLEVIEDIKQNGISAKELEKARNQVAKSAVLAMATNSGKARRLGTAAVLQGNIDQVNKNYAELMSVTADDIQRIANTYLDQNSRFEIIIRPQLSQLSKVLDIFKPKKKKQSDATTKPAETKK
ncbi:MAG: insulinase family protein [Planctomycetota bacterium]|nr:MAG: insulinase family protein [Planctomycetota bacterium]